MILKSLKLFFQDFVDNRELILKLSINDFRRTYTGSLIGATWVILHPLLLTLIFMLVFGFGFRSHAPIGEVPFVIWFLCGLFCWNFFSDTTMNNTDIFKQYSFLLKKVNFRLSIIPIIKVLSNTMLHCIYIILLFGVLFAYQIPFTIYSLQLIYYFFAMFVLLIAISWLISSLNLILPDTRPIVNVLMRIGFFATPIFWRIETINPSYQFIFKLNPMYYILQGYRDSLIFHQPFWYDMNMTIYFWGFTIITLAIGIYVFIKLRPQMADLI